MHFLKLTHKNETYAHNRRYYNPKACSDCPQKCTAFKYRTVTFKEGVVQKKAQLKNTIIKILDGYCSIRSKEVKTKFFVQFYPDMEKLHLRKQIVEQPFGSVKRWRDGSYLRLKGKHRVNADLAFSYLGYNLKRTINIIDTKKLLEAL